MLCEMFLKNEDQTHEFQKDKVIVREIETETHFSHLIKLDHGYCGGWN